MSLRLAALDLLLRLREKPYLARETDFPRARARMERLSRVFSLPPGARLREAPLGPVPALRIDAPPRGPSGAPPARTGGAAAGAAPAAPPANQPPDQAPDAKAAPPAAPVLVWLHGGAYCLGSPRTHAALAANLARRIGAAAILPDYRLAPEDPFPAALDDAAAAWAALLAEGVAPSRIVLGGDSAGGGLAFALLARLIAEGAPLPAAAIGFSPWADLTQTAPSLASLARRDALIPVRRFAEIRDRYLAGADPRDPRASPVLARFAGAPPAFLQSSRAEVLRDDARALAARLRADGVAVTHDEWARTPHVWQMYHGFLPEADRALATAAVFLAGVLARETAPPAQL